MYYDPSGHTMKPDPNSLCGTGSNSDSDKTLAAGVGSEVGSASKEGDFSNLYGSTVDEILDIIPDEAVLRELRPVDGGVTEGFEFRWEQDGQSYKLRVHNADPGAPAGSNAANGWIARVRRGTQYYDYTINDFQPARYTNPKGDFFDENIMNNTHIPIKNPYESLDI